MPSLSIIWRAAGLTLAMEGASVAEVLPPVAYRPCPGAPGSVRGLFVYRARLIPLVDGARLLGAQPPDDRMMNRVLVVRIGGERRVDWPVGIWVESVLDLCRVDFASRGSHPGLADPSARFLGPVAESPHGLVQLVRPAELFTPEQVALITGRLNEAAA